MTHPRSPGTRGSVTLAGMKTRLSPSDWAVLAALGEGAAHGFKLAAMFAKRGDLGTVWTVQRPQVYRALEHLERAGLAESVGHEPGGGPPRLRYALTRAGREALNTWLNTPVTHLRDTRSELLLKLTFLERARRDAAPLLSAQTARFRAVQRDYEARRAAARGAERLALEWRLEALAAALRFLEGRRRARCAEPPAHLD